MSRSKTTLIALGGMVAGVIVATGITGMALAAGNAPSGPQVTTSTVDDGDGPMGDHMGPMMGNRAGGGRGGMHLGAGTPVHGIMVTQDSSGAFVTAQSVHGTVTAISATSITVKAADGFTATYVINGDTDMHIAGTTGSASSITAGNEVMVMGTGTGTSLTAIHIGSGALFGKMRQS